jgi:hypothetical protein
MILIVKILVELFSNIPYKYRPGSATKLPSLFNSGVWYSIIKFFNNLASVSFKIFNEVGKYTVFNATPSANWISV